MAKQITGTVISTKMMKTIVVRVERRYRHPMYQKVIARHDKYKAHYEGTDLHDGDVVTIRETRPISKDKHFIFVEKQNPAKTEVKSKLQTAKRPAVARIAMRKRTSKKAKS